MVAVPPVPLSTREAVQVTDETASRCRDLIDQAVGGRRLTPAEGVELFMGADLLDLGRGADAICQQRSGSKVYYTNNLNINPTNLCTIACQLCAWFRTKADADHYLLTKDEFRERVSWAKDNGIFELHVVAGLHPDFDLDYAVWMIEESKRIHPDSFFQGYTAIEIEYLGRRAGLSVAETVARMKAAGLDSVPGGGAEVFASDLREHIALGKLSGDDWLEVHREVHKAGLRSNATMLYGHIETPANLVDHLERLRSLQDETGGFLALVPLAFHPENTAFQALTPVPAVLDLRVIALSRLYLDNFPHVRLLWYYVGERIAQVALEFGVDDFGGTSFGEEIVHAAGATSAVGMRRARLRDILEAAGREPVEVNSCYR